MKLRDYQDYAVSCFFRYFEERGAAAGNPLIVMPTGTGKSPVIAGIIKEVCFRYPGQRILKLTHVKELISQNFEKLLAVWPTAPAGILSAGLGRKDIGLQITYAGIATVKAVVDQLGHIDLIFVDECHLVSPKGDTMYRQVIKELTKINPYLKVVGLTATPFRVGQGMLTDEGGIFTDICCDMGTLEAFNWFIDEGYLSPLIPAKTEAYLDTTGVSTQNGEFNSKELQAAVDHDEITMAALQETVMRGKDRRRWLIFATGVKHTENVTAILNSLGVTAVCVHSKMPEKVRDKAIADYKAGLYTAMVNNGILTTGFDDPLIDLEVILRPTQSPGLWVQILGRGTRPVYAPGYDLSTKEGRLAAIQAGPKQNCLVLDFARNTPRLGPINDPVIPKKRGKGGNSGAPVKICEVCGAYNHASVRFCIQCNYEFPKVLKIVHSAGTEELIRGSKNAEPIIEEFPVQKVIYREHRKEGKPASLRISYYSGLRLFEDWACFEHDGLARARARGWWREAAKTEPPETTLEAISRLGELQCPKLIRVQTNTKYPEVKGHVY